jgi:heme/copper-type cytochrome/quinol oxidase subunit 2
MDHGFMPIVVRVLSRTEYDTWLSSQKAAAQTSQNTGQ